MHNTASAPAAMSALQMPMPVPYLVSLNPVQPSATGHAPAPDSATTSNMSPSNHSAHSSAYALPPSTAATSPVSSFPLGFGGAAVLANQAVNPHSTTRILLLSDFSKELKTRDIQLVFAEWEDDRGGFKIKWVDDTSCLIVFADPGVAKRAFLSVLSNPPSSLTVLHGDGGGRMAKLRAYNGPDVTHILASVQNRPRSRSNASQSLHSRGSSVASNGGLGRRPSMGAMVARNRASLSAASGVGMRGAVPPTATAAGAGVNPLVQAQVQELIDHVTTTHSSGPPSATGFGPTSAGSRPSTANSDITEQASPATSGAPLMRARIDDAGKRFIAAGLSKPNSTISHIPISELDETSNSASYSLAHLTIEEEATTPTAASH